MARTKMQSEEAGDGGEVLRAQLSITPDSNANCVVLGEAEDAESVTQQLKVPQSCFEALDTAAADECSRGGCGECHTEVSRGEDNGSAYFKSAVHEKCICPVFEDHDCIPTIKGVRDGAVITVVTMRDRSTLSEMLADLQDINADVSIEWLVRGREPNSTAEIDVSEITETQQETLETAIEAGYYETPRSASLDDLSDELSISKSAVSQRLNTAETKLVKSFVGER